MCTIGRNRFERGRCVVPRVVFVLAVVGWFKGPDAFVETATATYSGPGCDARENPGRVLFELYTNSTPRLTEYETREVSFSERSSLAILGDGWKTRQNVPYWQYGRIVWATKLFADLEVTVLVPRDLELSLELMPHFLEELPAQRVEVFWERHRLGEVLFEKDEEWASKKPTFLVPREIQKRGRNKVTLSSQYAVSRRSVKGEGVSREVAVALRRLDLCQKGGEPEVSPPLLEMQGTSILQNAFARVRMPLSLPDRQGLSLVVTVKGSGKLVLCEDAVYGPKETVLWEQCATGQTEGELRLDLAPWRGRIMELRFESSGSNGNDRVEWLAPRVLCRADEDPAHIPDEDPGISVAPKAKNVVLIVLDALRADGLGCYGSKRNTSPFIDALAESGLVFTRAYSAATETFASTTSLLTSLHPFSHGVQIHTDRLANEGLLLQYWLRSHGVSTGCVSQNPFLSPPNALGQRFDEFRGVFGEEGQTTEGCREVTDAALSIARGFGDNRFFLYVHYLPPHAPYSMSGEYEHTFSIDPSKAVQVTPAWIRDACDRKNLLDEYGAVQLRARYDENVRQADDCVKELVSGLREMGLGKETVVIVLADHGEEFMEHGWVGHGGAPRETQCHIPLVLSTLSTEGLRAERSYSDPVGTVDIAPSICALLGVDAPSHAQGRNLFGPLENSDAPYYTLGLTAMGVEGFTFGRFRLLVDTAGVTRNLYDLERDPEEKYDVSSTLPILTDYLEAQASAWRETLTRRFEALNVPLPPVSEAEEETGSSGTTHQEELRALGYL